MNDISLLRVPGISIIFAQNTAIIPRESRLPPRPASRVIAGLSAQNRISNSFTASFARALARWGLIRIISAQNTSSSPFILEGTAIISRESRLPPSTLHLPASCIIAGLSAQNRISNTFTTGGNIYCTILQLLRYIAP